jgi:RHS repeat-associated protein
VDLVTDLDGEAYELFLYNPWGEQLHHWSSNSSSWTSPYRFNAKEQDPETGIHYYGARYYNPETTVWLSVDKMASLGPNISPYAFSHNNPVMKVDPDGNWPFWLGVTTTFFEARVSIGVGVLGAHAIVQSGVARDEVGKTHFTNRTTVGFNTLKGRDATLALGAMASAMGGVSQDFDTETYLGQSFESSASVTAGAAAGLSVSLSAGERGVGVSAGIGYGAEVSMYETETVESISLTWDQSDNVNSKATSGNTSWSVGNKRRLADGTWVGRVSIGVGKDKVTTDTLIYSTDEKTWMSRQYENLAREAEGL